MTKKKKTESHVELDREARERLEDVIDPERLDRTLEGLTPEEITGSGGLLTELAGRAISAALQGELDGHLDRPHRAPAMDGNHRNGATGKTLATEVGDVGARPGFGCLSPGFGVLSAPHGGLDDHFKLDRGEFPEGALAAPSVVFRYGSSKRSRA